LGQIGDAQAVEPLIAALEDENSGVRGAAAIALKRIDTPEALAALEEPRL
jgi:HEAT repeat protein